MTREEKLELNRVRSKAVRDAWSNERELVMSGRGTVDWSKEQQKELIEKGHVSGFEGHHMKSVNEYPEWAGSASNIQFVSQEDHLDAHNHGEINQRKGFHSATNGYYDTNTKSMMEFGEGPPIQPKSFELTESYARECVRDLQNSHNINKQNMQLKRTYSKELELQRC